MEQEVKETVETTVNVDSNVETQPEVKTEVKPEVKEEVKVEQPVETKKEIMIPKERFDEVNNNFKQLKAELDELKKAQKGAEKEEPVKEEVKEVVPNPELEALQKQVESFNTLLDGMVQDKLKAIPEELRELIPEGLSTEQKLAWINKAEEKGLFKKQVQVAVGQPLNHSSEQNQAERIKKMNPLQALASYYSQGK